MKRWTCHFRNLHEIKICLHKLNHLTHKIIKHVKCYSEFFNPKGFVSFMEALIIKTGWRLLFVASIFNSSDICPIDGCRDEPLIHHLLSFQPPHLHKQHRDAQILNANQILSVKRGRRWTYEGVEIWFQPVKRKIEEITAGSLMRSQTAVLE